MFDTLTQDENNQLFMALHRAYGKADRLLSYLITADAPDHMYRPALGVITDTTELMADLQATL